MDGSIGDNLSGAIPAFVTSLIPILVGGLATHCKLFINSPDDFRNRIRLKRAEFFEQVTSAHCALLTRVMRIQGTDEILRGDERKEPDLVLEYTHKIFRFFRLAGRLEVLNWLVRAGYLVLYLTICTGLIGAVSALLLPQFRFLVVCLALGALLLQILTVLSILLLGWRLELYEDIS